MLKKYLDNAITDLHTLIDITNKDIENIKKGEHVPIFEQVATKEKLVETFEAKKRQIDQYITKKVSENKGIPLNQVLDEVERAYLDQLKNKLLELKEVNKRFARLVVSVGTFYSSLLEKIVPTEMDGYETVIKQSASFLEIKG